MGIVLPNSVSWASVGAAGTGYRTLLWKAGLMEQGLSPLGLTPLAGVSSTGRSRSPFRSATSITR